MVLVVFRTTIRAGIDTDVGEEAEAKSNRMLSLASEMPGFISYKEFYAQDGESVAIVEFDDEEKLLAWKEHPEHVKVQEWGRKKLFKEYRIQVCSITRAYGFDMDKSA